jgi:TrmH family RNA methyltransferase
MDQVITSPSNPLIKRIRGLHRQRGRRRVGLTLVEGPILFAQMAAAGVTPEVILMLEDDVETLTLCEKHRWEPVAVSREVLALAGDTVQPQSPVAAIPIPDTANIRGHDTLILVDISDPGNVGTMIRSAAAFGWDVCISGSTADPWSPKVLRAGAGSHFDVHLVAASDPIAEAQKAELDVVASVVTGGGRPDRRGRSIALLIGSEAHGLSAATKALADRMVTIPMSDRVESLNAGVAASVLMYLLARAR